FFLLLPPQTPRSTLFPYTTLFRSLKRDDKQAQCRRRRVGTPPLPGGVRRGISAWVHSSSGSRSMESWRCPKNLKNGWKLSRRHRSEEHTSELQSRGHLVCRLLLEK